METLEKRRERLDMIQTYKILHGVDRVEKSTWLSLTSERGHRDTRATADKTKLEIGRARTEQRRTTFGLRAVEKWNSLPREMRE